ncbi:MAG: hypothetical protein QF793_01625 [Candidatus Peribacteraceae bacterium]|nr:hypothetical protein [bacterium]MDP6561603.1 hypothetical protein [Candidatus Peribacteraceae bacterium]
MKQISTFTKVALLLTVAIAAATGIGQFSSMKGQSTTSDRGIYVSTLHKGIGIGTPAKIPTNIS